MLKHVDEHDLLRRIQHQASVANTRNAASPHHHHLDQMHVPVRMDEERKSSQRNAAVASGTTITAANVHAHTQSQAQSHANAHTHVHTHTNTSTRHRWASNVSLVSSQATSARFSMATSITSHAALTLPDNMPESQRAARLRELTAGDGDGNGNGNDNDDGGDVVAVAHHDSSADKARRERRELRRWRRKWRKRLHMSREQFKIALLSARIVGIMAQLYLFLLSLNLLSDSFKVLSGQSAGDVFAVIDNSVAAVMVGVLATVLVQSSSTTTSIVIALVSSSTLGVPTAIYIIFGANIGTCSTAIIVSLATSKYPKEFGKAFSAASVNHIYNMMSVLMLTILEATAQFIRHTSGALVDVLLGISGGKFKSPISEIVKPITTLLLEADKKKVEESAQGKAVSGSFIKGGVFEGTNDNVAGGICLAISILVLYISLMFLVKMLKSTLAGAKSRGLQKALAYNSAYGMFVGCALTGVVQSSSVTTSALIPLAGVGAITLSQVYPILLGANIGTTVTSLLAAMATGSPDALQIALSHVIFNIVGVFVFFPIPPLRNFTMRVATSLGDEVRKNRIVALIYTLGTFIIVPVILLLLALSGITDLIVGSTVMFILITASISLVWIMRHRSMWLPAWFFQWHLRPEERTDPEAIQRAGVQAIETTLFAATVPIGGTGNIVGGVDPRQVFEAISVQSAQGLIVPINPRGPGVHIAPTSLGNSQHQPLSIHHEKPPHVVTRSNQVIPLPGHVSHHDHEFD